MHWNEAWSWNAVVKAVSGESIRNWLRSSNLRKVRKLLMKSPEILMPNYVTPHIPVFLLSLVFRLSDSNFSYLCYQLWKWGCLKVFLFCSVPSWQNPAYSTAYTLRTSTTASVLEKERKTHPTDFLASTRPERTCCSAGMWQEAIYKELTLPVTLCSWFSKIWALKKC